jgi:hypothetical protein
MARRDGRAAVHAGIGEADAVGWFGHLGAASFDFGLLGVDFHAVAAGLLVREQSRDFSPFSPLASDQAQGEKEPMEPLYSTERSLRPGSRSLTQSAIQKRARQQTTSR